jgi:MoxR-like ATPase
MTPTTQAQVPADWKVFGGTRPLTGLPLPPWRKSDPITVPESFDANLLERDKRKAQPFLPDDQMIWAVNAALYLRRPLLLTGKPGSGKSTLISKVAQDLSMGPVLRWDVTSRSTVRSGVYEYDAVGRLQKSRPGAPEPLIEEYLTLGPLGTALLGTTWPRALLIDEIDKGDLDLANDLLNVIEEGVYEIPELHRLGDQALKIRDGFGRQTTITQGRIECKQFPFVVMTSNAEREFPPPFLRRCVRLTIQPPNDMARLAQIVRSHLDSSLSPADRETLNKLIQAVVSDTKPSDSSPTPLTTLMESYLQESKTTELATDQLLNAVFLTIGMNDGAERTFSDGELTKLRIMLLEKLA